MRGRCVVLGGGGTSPFFWRFVKSAHSTADCLKKVVLLVTPSVYDVFFPLLLAALPAAFFIACWRPNLIGTHYQNCRIPYSPGETIGRRVNGSSNRGR